MEDAHVTTKTNNRPPKRRFVIDLRQHDFDWRPALAKAARKFDRAQSHLARQLIIKGLYQLGELPDRDAR